MRKLLLIALALGCSEPTQIALQYDLVTLKPEEVARVETLIAVDPSDARNFFADQPYRQVADGVGYEVRDFDGTGKRRVLITHDATLGYVFTQKFVFTLLPPSGMAPPPLVLVARAVGESDRIGSSAVLKASFGEGRSVAVPIMDLRCNGLACAAGEICCKGVCTDTSGDQNNCGSCETACGQEADGCALGTCRCGSGSACAEGQTCCSGLGCVDLQTSAFHCGTCGKSCNPGESCQAGVCKCGGAAGCGDNGLCCADGSCSATGSCPCGMQNCNTPNVCCDPSTSACLDVRSDSANCGACGVACALPLSCQNGACTCQGQICGAGDACCSTGCANLMNDPVNCGFCGRGCVPGESCANGQCKCGNTMCNDGEICCDGTCLDPDEDSMNCGGCDVICNPGETCMGGMCTCPGTSPARACTSPPEGCCAASDRDSGGCFDLDSTHDHCGTCGIACKTNEECQAGKCVITSCDPPCTNKNMCQSSTGQCQCNGGAACSDPNSCCSGGCTDIRSDRDNCGNCGTDCTDNQLCCDSGCVNRDASRCQACNMGCVASGNRPVFCCGSGNSWMCQPENISNCGGCNKACMLGQVCCPGAAAGAPSTCRAQNDFACGVNCTNCNATGGVCCNNQCCSTQCCNGVCCGQGQSCCNGVCCGGLCTLGACIL